MARTTYFFEDHKKMDGVRFFGTDVCQDSANTDFFDRTKDQSEPREHAQILPPKRAPVWFR